MGSVKNRWTLVRLKDISAGFVADADWEVTNDIAGWRTANPIWHRPNLKHQGAGEMEFMVSFYDNISTNIPAAGNTRVDIQAIELMKLTGIPERLIDLGTDRQIPGDTVLSAVNNPPFSAFIAYRVFAAQNLPNADFLAVEARLI